jgi:hypothetical protein
VAALTYKPVLLLSSLVMNPEFANMAASSVLDELSAHLDEVEANPATALDEHLLERCELFASTSD